MYKLLILFTLTLASGEQRTLEVNYADHYTFYTETGCHLAGIHHIYELDQAGFFVGAPKDAVEYDIQCNSLE